MVLVSAAFSVALVGVLVWVLLRAYGLRPEHGGQQKGIPVEYLQK